MMVTCGALGSSKWYRSRVIVYLYCDLGIQELIEKMNKIGSSKRPPFFEGTTTLLKKKSWMKAFLTLTGEHALKNIAIG